MSRLKCLLALTSLFTASSIFAAQPGLYLGGQLGYGYVHDSGISDGDMGQMINAALGHGDFTRVGFNGTASDSGFAWRAFGGYQIGYNWAVEIGWSHFPRLPTDASETGFDFDNDIPYSAGTSGTFQTNAFDGVVKYLYVFPWFCQMNVYGKAGLAYVVGRSNSSVSVFENKVVFTAEDQDITDRLYPTFGLGLSYDFRPDISTDLSYTRIQKVGNSDQLGSIDVVMLALALHFG